MKKLLILFLTITTSIFFISGCYVEIILQPNNSIASKSEAVSTTTSKSETVSSITSKSEVVGSITSKSEVVSTTTSKSEVVSSSIEHSSEKSLSSKELTNSTTLQPKPVDCELIDFGTRSELSYFTDVYLTSLGDDVVVGEFTILGGCKYKRIDTKPKYSSDGKYIFFMQVQLPAPNSSGAIGGSYAEKSIRFSTTGAATLILYCNRSTSYATLDCEVCVVNDSEIQVAAAGIPGDSDKAYLITINIPSAGNYALTGNLVTGVNVFGVGLTY